MEQVDQPKPVFTLDDLAQKLDYVYTRTMSATHYFLSQDSQEAKFLAEANGIIQELIAIVDKHKRDLTPIDVPYATSEPVTTELNQQKPDHYICGVQLIENKALVGTSLYTTVIKARQIRDVLNKRFAELKVNHEAKIVNYPVF
jgi:hypothetical protein